MKRSGIAIAALMCCSPAIADDLPPTYTPTLQEARQRLLEGDLTTLFQYHKSRYDHHLSLITPAFREDAFTEARRRKGLLATPELASGIADLVKEMDFEHREAAAEAAYQMGRLQEIVGREEEAKVYYRRAAELVDRHGLYAIKAGIHEPTPVLPTPQPMPLIQSQPRDEVDQITDFAKTQFAATFQQPQFPYMPWGWAAGLLVGTLALVHAAKEHYRSPLRVAIGWGSFAGLLGMLAQYVYTYA